MKGSFFKNKDDSNEEYEIVSDVIVTPIHPDDSHHEVWIKRVSDGYLNSIAVGNVGDLYAKPKDPRSSLRKCTAVGNVSYFHGFSTNSEGDSIAIIEALDGSVNEFNTWDVRFIDV